MYWFTAQSKNSIWVFHMVASTQSFELSPVASQGVVRELGLGAEVKLEPGCFDIGYNCSKLHLNCCAKHLPQT